MLIAVGSLNPVKVGAVRAVIGRVWPSAEVVGVDAPTGVSAMPLSDDECIAGARCRAQAAREQLDADLGFGLEGGVQEAAGQVWLVGWVAMVDRDGRCGMGGTARLPLPERIAAAVRAGAELGPYMDALLGEENVRQRGGAVGALTAGLVSRQAKFETAVAYALAPLINAALYG